MKVLFFSEHDGYNSAIINIIKALKDRGHEVSVYGRYTNENYMYIFSKNNITVHNIQELNNDIIDEHDIVFARNSFLYYEGLIKIRKYVFSYNTLYFDQPNSGADFVFSSGESWKKNNDLAFRTECATMEIGNVKFDNVVFDTSKKKTYKMLFIDSGHYPFGHEGKSTLAELLLQICYKFPEYELVIKPRFLPDDDIVTHRNSDHLYKYINQASRGKIPGNMTMLTQHRAMMDLISDCDVVLCMYTSAYLDAALSGKNLVIIDGLPNEDSYDLRNETFWKPVREILKDTGCLVDHRDVLKYLPEGIKCSDRHIRAHVYGYGNISDKIAGVMEYLWANYISKSLYPGIGLYKYQGSEDDVRIDPGIDLDSLVTNRYKNMVYHQVGVMLKRFGTTDRQIYTALKDRILNIQQRDGFSWEDYHTIKNEIINVFLENKDRLPRDKITQGFLFHQMIRSGKLEEIIRISEEEVLNKELYHFTRGCIAFYENNPEQAVRDLQHYLSIVNSHSYYESIADTDIYKNEAHALLVILFLSFGDRRQSEEYFNKIPSTDRVFLLAQNALNNRRFSYSLYKKLFYKFQTQNLMM